MGDPWKGLAPRAYVQSSFMTDGWGKRTGSMPLILNSTSSSKNAAEASALLGSAICT